MRSKTPPLANSSAHPAALLDALKVPTAGRPAMPIAVYPGIALTGATILDIVTDAQAKAEAALALRERYHSQVLLSAMDLSAEAQAFGAEVMLSMEEVPTVLQAVLSSPAEIKQLDVPAPAEARTRVYLETIRQIRAHAPNAFVLGGCIGPFSLAGRLAGVSEAFELTMTDPALLHELLEKCTGFLEQYVKAFLANGADGVIMAEPSAGLLSPSALRTYSSPYVRRIIAALPPCAFVLHNCAARLVHLSAILEAGAGILHFGAPMDLPAALGRVGQENVVCGNLDPAAVFCQPDPEFVFEQTQTLLKATAAHSRHVLSSGCDLPPQVPLSNLDAFYAAVGSV